MTMKTIHSTVPGFSPSASPSNSHLDSSSAPPAPPRRSALAKMKSIRRRRLGSALAALLSVALGGMWCLVPGTRADQSTWRNFAGTAGQLGSADGAGSAARFFGPNAVAVGSDGTVYVADSDNHTIRKITPAGITTTLAGSHGASGTADGTGAAARFYIPLGVAVDGPGNVYVADTDNHTIRKITPAGVVTTLAGSPGLAGSADGTGAAARFNQPGGVAVDGSANIYVADTYNYTIRKITPGGVVTTLAGSPNVLGAADGTGSAAQFNLPGAVAANSTGTLYVADTYNSTIRKITPGGVVTTLAGSAGIFGASDGTGASALFMFPTGLAVDGNGFVYVADTSNANIRKITAAGLVTTIGGLDAWLLNGATLLSAVHITNGGLPAIPASGWNIVNAIDFNGDGKPDLVFFNPTTHQTFIWYLDGTAYIGETPGPTAAAGWTLASVEDFNADGKPDFLWFQPSTRKSFIWFLNGATIASEAYLVDTVGVPYIQPAGYNIVAP